MVNESKFDKKITRLFDILLRLYNKDLFDALEDKSSYMKISPNIEFGKKLNYSELNLDEYQQDVIENHLKCMKYEMDAKVLLSYIKAIEHTIKLMKETEILHKNDTP